MDQDQIEDDNYLETMKKIMDMAEKELNGQSLGSPRHGIALFVFPVEDDDREPRSITNLTPESFHALLAKLVNVMGASRETQGSA